MSSKVKKVRVKPACILNPLFSYEKTGDFVFGLKSTPLKRRGG